MNNDFLNSERENEIVSKKHKKFRVLDLVAYFLCLVISFGIWMYVVSVENDNYEHTFENVAVQLEGVNELKNDRHLSILSGYDTTINITVVGSRRDILQYTSEDIYAYVNLDGIVKADRHALDVIVDLPDNMKMVSSNPAKVNVFVDETVSIPFDIEVVPLYSLPDGYILHQAEPSVETVTVTGPKTILEEIAAARVTYDIGTVTNTVTFISTIDLVNADGEKVENPYIKTDVSVVTVTIPVTMQKTLFLVAEYQADDQENFNYKIEFTPATIEVVGDPKILATMSEIKIDVGNVTKSKGGSTNKIELPEGVELYGEELQKISFTVEKTEIENSDK